MNFLELTEDREGDGEAVCVWRTEWQEHNQTTDWFKERRQREGRADALK